MLHELRQDARFYLQLLGLTKRSWIVRMAALATSRGLWILASQRLGHDQAARKKRSGWTPLTVFLRMIESVLQAMAIVVGKSEVLASIAIGPGVYLSDRGNLVIGARSIGTGTIIHHCVTIGMGLGDQGIPTIGRNVWIGPDCVIYGNITIGDGACVLPGTVVSRSLPPGALVQGSPPRVLGTNFDSETLRSSLAFDIDPDTLGSRRGQQGENDREHP